MEIVATYKIGHPQTIIVYRDSAGAVRAGAMVQAETFTDPSGTTLAVLTNTGSLSFVNTDGTLPKQLDGLPVILCGEKRGHVVCDGESVFMFGFCASPSSHAPRDLKVGGVVWNYLGK